MHAVVQRLAANMAGAGNAAVASDVPRGEEQLSAETTNAVNVWVGRIDGAFRRQELATAFAYARAGVHRHGAASEKLSKRWLCMLDLLAARAQPHKTQPTSRWPPPPPEVLSLRKLLEELPDELKAELKGLAGEGSTRPGRRFKCVLLRERSTIVVGLSEPEWQARQPASLPACQPASLPASQPPRPSTAHRPAAAPGRSAGATPTRSSSSASSRRRWCTASMARTPRMPPRRCST